jgi:hypothetical protein
VTGVFQISKFSLSEIQCFYSLRVEFEIQKTTLQKTGFSDFRIPAQTRKIYKSSKLKFDALQRPEHLAAVDPFKPCEICICPSSGSDNSSQDFGAPCSEPEKFIFFFKDLLEEHMPEWADLYSCVNLRPMDLNFVNKKIVLQFFFRAGCCFRGE